MIFTQLIHTNLRTKEFGRTIEYYQRLGSTNDEAWALINNGESTHGMIVITDNQFQGKGRSGNTWFMGQSKGLAFSLIYEKNISIRDASLIPIAIGVSVAKTLENRGATPSLKWPNDIHIHGKKVGGILCESKISGQQVTSMVIGVGLNINETVQDFPDEINNLATSLSVETNHGHQRELVCAILTTYFEQSLERLTQMPNEWLSYCNHLDKVVSFKHDSVSKSGIFRKINSEGHAEIEVDGNLTVFPSIILD